MPVTVHSSVVYPATVAYPAIGSGGVEAAPSIVNLLLFSNDLSNATAWNDGGVTATSGFAAPDGNTEAKLVVNSAGGSKSLYQILSAQPAGVYTAYLNVRADTVDAFSFGVYALSVGFLPSTVTILSGPGAYVGTNNVNMTGLSAVTRTAVKMTVTSGVTDDLYLFFYPRNGTTDQLVGDSVFVWKPMLYTGSATP